VTGAAASAFGRTLPPGTTVVATPDREGSNIAVAYPLGAQTIVWCSADLRSELASLNGPIPLSCEDFLIRAERLGGVAVGRGNHRVLPKPAPDPALGSAQLVVLRRDDPNDRRRISAFIDGCSASDLDEAELAIDELDEAIVAVTDDSGALAAYASARPWAIDARFDDIAVITHPDHRGHGFATAAVVGLSRWRQRQGRSMFYNCDVDNVGSNRVAEAAGFEYVYTVAGASFG
jgi:GNAT superfamily N-acetyltransferase